MDVIAVIAKHINKIRQHKSITDGFIIPLVLRTENKYKKTALVW